MAYFFNFRSVMIHIFYDGFLISIYIQKVIITKYPDDKVPVTEVKPLYKYKVT